LVTIFVLFVILFEVRKMGYMMFGNLTLGGNKLKLNEAEELDIMLRW